MAAFVWGRAPAEAGRASGSAPAEAGRASGCALAEARKLHTWDEIVAVAADTPRQPRERPKEALKHFRDLAETPVGVPSGIAIDIQLSSPVVLIRKCTHGVGEQFAFDVGGELAPWSWRRMALSLGEEKGKMIVGSGVARISLYQRPGSYDHHRAAALRQQGALWRLGRRFWIGW